MELRVVNTLEQPGDFLPQIETKPVVMPGERIIYGYLLCPKKCPDALAVGGDQLAGKAVIVCHQCNGKYYINGENIVALGK